MFFLCYTVLINMQGNGLRSSLSSSWVPWFSSRCPVPVVPQDLYKPFGHLQSVKNLAGVHEEHRATSKKEKKKSREGWHPKELKKESLSSDHVAAAAASMWPRCTGFSCYFGSSFHVERGPLESGGWFNVSLRPRCIFVCCRMGTLFFVRLPNGAVFRLTV